MTDRELAVLATALEADVQDILGRDIVKGFVSCIPADVALEESQRIKAGR